MESTIFSLWTDYLRASSLLINKIGGTNIVGEMAERIIADYYKGEQLTVSSKSADIKCPNGNLIQVKSRILKNIRSTPLGVIRSWDFDLLVVVLFAPNGHILKAIELDSDNAKKISKYNQHQNGWIITTNRSLLDHKKRNDITDGLNIMLNTNESEMITPKDIIPSEDINLFKHNHSDYMPIFYNGKYIRTKRTENESFQDFVKSTLIAFFNQNMLSDEEIKHLQTKEYSKKTFGLEMPLLEKNSSKLRDANGTARYWIKTPIGGGFYACSQWWRAHLNRYEPKFASWIEHIIEMNINQ